MSRLMRTDIFNIAAENGWEKGKVLPEEAKDVIRTKIKEALRSSDFAPTRVYDGDTGNFRLMTVDEAAENLLEELV